MIADDVRLGSNVVIHQPGLVNFYGCAIGDGTKVGAFVEIQRGASIGRNCKISSHSFICSGVTLEDGVFVGHGVMFVNDRYPSAVNLDGSLQTEADWTMLRTRIKKTASLGSNATILGGQTVVGHHSVIGSSAWVTHSIAPFTTITIENPSMRIREGHDGVAEPD